VAFARKLRLRIRLIPYLDMSTSEHFGDNDNPIPIPNPKN